MLSCFVRGHTLEPSCVGHLGAWNNQPSTTGYDAQPLALSDRLSVFIPPEKILFWWVVLGTTQIPLYFYLLVWMRRGSYVMTGAGVPVAWHSSSSGLLIMTVLSVTSSAPSMKGGTTSVKHYAERYMHLDYQTDIYSHFRHKICYSTTMTVTDRGKSRNTSKQSHFFKGFVNYKVTVTSNFEMCIW